MLSAFDALRPAVQGGMPGAGVDLRLVSGTGETAKGGMEFPSWGSHLHSN